MISLVEQLSSLGENRNFTAIKIGYLVSFVVVKNLPNYDSYLVSLPGTGLLAQLPKKYAQRAYKINETGWAAVFTIDMLRITLSQKSPQYIRRILEYLLSPLVASGEIRIKRVAKLSRSHFLKVVIDGNDISRETLYEICRPFLHNLKDYIQDTVCLVKYSKDLKEYVINAFAPAPASSVVSVLVSREEGVITLYVENKDVGFFLGKKGEHVLTVSKLIGMRIEVKGV